MPKSFENIGPFHAFAVGSSLFKQALSSLRSQKVPKIVEKRKLTAMHCYGCGIILNSDLASISGWCLLSTL